MEINLNKDAVFFNWGFQGELQGDGKPIRLVVEARPSTVLRHNKAALGLFDGITSKSEVGW